MARPHVGARDVRVLFHKVVQLALILASQSAIRQQMLDQAGVAYSAMPAGIDENFVKHRLSDPRMIALELSRAKALAISRDRPKDWVIGSDSVVSVGNRQFGKPESRNQAAEHLRIFSGRPMLLSSAVALARDGELDWNHVETARLQVRTLSADFIAAYLDAEWPQVGGCVGVFRMEARGVQLFEAVDGSHFTILGMPLIPLLGALRERRLLAS